MKHDLELKLMALLDGELSPAEAREVERLCATDREATALLGELRQTRALLAENEPQAVVPVSREFYWSRIQREIDRLEVPPATGSPSAWQRLRLVFRRYSGAFAGVGVAAALALMATHLQNPTAVDLFEDVDNPVQDGGVFSFRSEEHGATLVWVTAPAANDDEDDNTEPN